MNIILLGMPGSGKGTQADLLVEKLNFFYFQAGKLARDLAKRDPRIARIVGSGQLIPEEEMTDYVGKYLDKYLPEGKNVLFEGYPRFIKQYEYLKDWAVKKGDDIDAVVFINISEEEAIKRLSSRRICKDCGEVYNLVTNPPPKGECECGGKLIRRKDDRPESIKKRFQMYRENTKKLVDYVDKNGNLIKVDGERSINVIFKDIVKRIKNA